MEWEKPWVSLRLVALAIQSVINCSILSSSASFFMATLSTKLRIWRENLHIDSQFYWTRCLLSNDYSWILIHWALFLQLWEEYEWHLRLKFLRVSNLITVMDSRSSNKPLEVLMHVLSSFFWDILSFIRTIIDHKSLIRTLRRDAKELGVLNRENNANIKINLSHSDLLWYQPVKHGRRHKDETNACMMDVR